MKQIVELERSRQEYTAALEAYEEDRRAAAELINIFETKNAVVQKADNDRIQVLEKKLHDSPREKLRRISAQLEHSDPEKENVVDFWVRQYQGGNAVHESERKKLEREKAELEKELMYGPWDPEEIELYNLRRKKKTPFTEEERNKLQVAEQNVESSYNEMCVKREKLREAHRIAKETLEEIGKEIGAAKTGDLESGFRDMKEQAARLLRE